MDLELIVENSLKKEHGGGKLEGKKGSSKRRTNIRGFQALCSPTYGSKKGCGRRHEDRFGA